MNILRRFLGYTNKTYSLYELLENIILSRQKEIIPSWDIVYSAFIMSATRMGSINALEESSSSAFWKKVLQDRTPSADEIGWASERIDIESIREMLYTIYRKARRNKVFTPYNGSMIVALDGHELFSSYSRCCSACLERQIEVNGQKKTQYYHRVVVAQLISQDFHFLFDVELQRKGEGEVSCAIRMVKRLLNRFPRSFRIVTVDALYAQAPFINLLAQKNKDVVVVLKDERRELYKDAAGLFAAQEPDNIIVEANKNSTQWDIEGFTSWDNLEMPIRVVRSLEETIVRKRTGNTWMYKTVTKDWIWATTLSKRKANTDIVAAIGHKRWGIENEGFNHLKLWHFNHCYHHHPVSILFFLLLIMISFNLFHVMLQRNFKPVLRNKVSRKLLSACMFSEITATLFNKSHPP